MKSLICRKGLVLIALVLFVMLSGAKFTLAQENKSPASGEKSMITIHISKEVNGETVKYDTTFEAGSDFNIDEFLEQKNLGVMPFPENKSDRKFHDFRFDWPEFDENFSFFPDSAEFDTLVRRLHNTYGDIMKRLPARPDFRWNYRFEDPGDEPEETPRPDLRGNDNDRPKRIPFNDNRIPDLMPNRFPGPEIAPFIGNSRPEKVIIHKKRHGKKVIITYKDDDMAMLPDDDIIFYRNETRLPQRETRHYRHMDPDMQKEMNFDIQKGNKGDNEKRVIIIEKKAEKGRK